MCFRESTDGTVRNAARKQASVGNALWIFLYLSMKSYVEIRGLLG